MRYRIFLTMNLFGILLLAGCGKIEDKSVHVNFEEPVQIVGSYDDTEEKYDQVDPDQAEDDGQALETPEAALTAPVRDSSVRSENDVDSLSDIEDIVDFSSMDEEEGVYFLVNRIKSMASSGSSYVSGFGSTAYILVSSYIAANPDSRFEAPLREILGKSKEIFCSETAIKGLDRKYDYPIEEMASYCGKRKKMEIEIVSEFEPKYKDDALGWLNRQYDAIKNTGKRTVYYAITDTGEEVLVQTENRMNKKGNVVFYAAYIENRSVIQNGFEKKIPLYYEISDELNASVSEDMEKRQEGLSALAKYKDELNTLLNQIKEG